jgi:hypothetical protein
MTTRLSASSAIIMTAMAAALLAAEQRPAVLFSAGVHNKYVTRPLVEMGIDVDVCPAGKLAECLESGKYNVVVVGTMEDAERKAVDAFLARGGGVLVCNPAAHPREPQFTATNEWLAAMGARPRWEILVDSDKANVVRDIMNCALSWSDKVSPPVNDGVRGVLTLMWGSTTGCEPPMSFDFSPDWNIVVRGAQSMTARPSLRNDIVLQPWIPKEDAQPSPPLMALREIGKGRIAVVGIRYYWIFTPPPNCPTAEAMLTAGAGDKPSDWLRVFANAFRWLAQPSLAAGMGGAGTPEEVLTPPIKAWDIPVTMEWGDLSMPGNQPQVTGLIGARTALSSGKGMPEDYAKAARAAGLQFIVFLEDSLKMDKARWDELVKACEALSDDNFSAVPGLTYEDAQGNHLYAFADNVQFPKPEMLLADGRLDTTRSSRTKVYFDYVNEYMGQKCISGLWRHKENFLHFADYKLYNSFPVFSAEDGKPVDDALQEYLYLQGIGGCHAALAFEVMTSPEEVAQRAKDGWRVVWYRSVSDLRGKWHHGAWSFHGMMSQYITNGPSILVWQAPNRLVGPNGLWWRPDPWEFRVLLRAASEDGLKSVSLYDGERLFRRWLPGGAKTFETQLVLSNCQQMGLVPVVEDVRGRRAIGMQSWNRNLNLEEFFCSDRCNFLGNSRLRTRDGRQVWTQVSFKANMGITPSKGRLDLSVQPATNLTLNSPTLPIDGAPAGFPTASINFFVGVPGELRHLFAYPVTWMVGPEIAVGQTDYRLGYDPAEEKAEKTPLGHPYEQPQHGWGNSWGSWHRLIPTLKLSGFSRTYACVWLPETFRIGWHESDVTLKEDVTLEGEEGFQVAYPSMPGWVIYRDGKPLAAPDANAVDGEFSRGTFAALEHSGGSVIVMPLEGPIEFHYRKGGMWRLNYQPKAKELPQGQRIRFQIAFAGAAGATPMAKMVEFAEKFGVAAPGKTGYAPDIKRGKQIDNYLIWRLNGEGSGIEAKIPRTDMPGFLPVCVENLNDNWSVQLLDRARPWPNHRALPIRDGRAYAQLDLNEGDLDIFIGHPVVADNPNVKLAVSWMRPGEWFVEANNPTDAPIKTRLTAAPGWTPFAFDQTLDLAPGAGRQWTVKEKE